MPQSILSPDDVRVLAAHAHRVADSYRSFTATMQRAVENFNGNLELWRILANTRPAVAGLEGRYQARAALDPAYTTEAARDTLVRAVLAGHSDGCLLLIPTSRATVAAAVLRGWTQTHDSELPAHGITWARALGSTHVLVTREVAA